MARVTPEGGEDGGAGPSKSVEIVAPSTRDEDSAAAPAGAPGAADRRGSTKADAAKAKAEKDRLAQLERRRAMSIRQVVYATLDDPDFSPLAKWWSLGMMVVIFVSTLAFVFESEVCQAATCDNVPGFMPFEASVRMRTPVRLPVRRPALNPLRRARAQWFFYYNEWICVLVFTIDYMLRFTCSARPHRFVIGVMNLIDLVAFLPFWIFGFMDTPMFATPSLETAGGGSAFGFIRAIRLVRVFRIFKVGKYALGFQIFAGALKNSTEAMGILAIVMAVRWDASRTVGGALPTPPPHLSPPAPLLSR